MRKLQHVVRLLASRSRSKHANKLRLRWGTHEQGVILMRNKLTQYGNAAGEHRLGVSPEHAGRRPIGRRIIRRRRAAKARKAPDRTAAVKPSSRHVATRASRRNSAARASAIRPPARASRIRARPDPAQPRSTGPGQARSEGPGQAGPDPAWSARSDHRPGPV